MIFTSHLYSLPFASLAMLFISLTREVLEINSSNDGSEINGGSFGSGQWLDSCGDSHGGLDGAFSETPDSIF